MNVYTTFHVILASAAVPIVAMVADETPGHPVRDGRGSHATVVGRCEDEVKCSRYVPDVLIDVILACAITNTAGLFNICLIEFVI